MHLRKQGVITAEHAPCGKVDEQRGEHDATQYETAVTNEHSAEREGRAATSGRRARGEPVGWREGARGLSGGSEQPCTRRLSPVARRHQEGGVGMTQCCGGYEATGYRTYS